MYMFGTQLFGSWGSGQPCSVTITLPVGACLSPFYFPPFFFFNFKPIEMLKEEYNVYQYVLKLDFQLLTFCLICFVSLCIHIKPFESK